MNRFINALLLFFFLPTLLLTIIVAFDIPVRIFRVSGANLPFRDIGFLTLGLLVLVINLRRSIRRWMGVRVVNNVSKFKWNVQVSKERRKRVNTYLALEFFIMTTVGGSLYVLTPEAWMPAIGYTYGGLDALIFMIAGLSGKKYRIGLSSKALIVADRDVILLYFTGLRQVSIHQQSIYFDYIKGLQLSFPVDCIPQEQQEEFFRVLENNTDRDKVYFRKGP